MPSKRISDIDTVPLQGGSNTRREKPSLPLGGFSYIQNMRGRHPGFVQRKGQRKLNLTADGTNEVVSLYQYKKTRVDDTHVYAQMSDGDVLEFTEQPPTLSSGTLGSRAFNGDSNNIPASWCTLNDLMIYSNGYDQHQLYGGDDSYVDDFFVVKSASSIPIIPTDGMDYTTEVTDGRTTTYAELDSLSTLANNHCLFIRTPIRANSITVTLSNANGTLATLQGHYWNGGAWSALSGMVDGTTTGGSTFGQSGTISWTESTDIEPKYQYGINGWWYRFSLSSGSFDSDVKVTKITFGSDWNGIKNIWSSSLIYPPEVQVYRADNSQYEVYGSAAVTISLMTTSDKVYFSTTDPIVGFYADPGAVPTSGTISINDVKYWDGNSWESVSNLNDGSNGLNKPGYVTFSPQTDAQKQQFQGTKYYAYWYYFTFSASIPDSTTMAIQTMPYFNIEDFGYSQASVVWKNRACYAFDRWSEYVYISAQNAPEVLNGYDYGIVEVGDGRSHAIVAMRKFYNELMVWQEEKGVEGGCITIIEGYSPETFGKLIMSSKLGTMSNKTVVVVDGTIKSTKTDESIKTMAYFISRYGVFATDGTTVWSISDPIQNYFDPQEEECIRYGYKNKMWMGYDSAEDVLRLGLVSGPNATTCNVFPVYDLADGSWYFDCYGQELACITEVDAASGNTEVVQIGGGVDDGTVYHLNYGNNDVGEAIDSYVRLEFTGDGQYLLLREMILKVKSETSGNAYIEIYNAGRKRVKKVVPITPEIYDQIVRRNRIPLNFISQHISIVIGNKEPQKTIYLEELGLEMHLWTRR